MRYNNYHKHDHVSNIFTPDTNTKQEEYILKALEYGHTTYSTVNHGSFGDIFEARTLCNKYGLRCIAGIEGYIVPDASQKDKRNYHIIVIPKTDEARKKMNYVSSMANIKGFYYKPRFFLSDLLKLDPNDVYITTACVAGLLRDDDSINEIFMPLYKHFKENVMLEVQTHDDPLQIEINKKAIYLSDQYGLSLIAANDSHYIDESGKEERLELLRGKHINYGSEDDFILDYPTAETMIERFKKQGVLTDRQISDALNNTLLFDECEEIQLDYSIKMPTIYPNLTPKQRVNLLKKEVNKRFKEIRKEEHIEGEEFKKYKEGIRYEMKIIEDTNDEIHTADYFLFNEKNVDLAVNKYGGVLTRGGRGSCGSFYINRILGMTQLDRFKINLPLFPDRFASTARLLENRSLPDIDFNVKEQEPFVRASRELLGEHGCYPMYAPGTMQISEAFRNVCRSKNMTFDEFNHVAKNLDEYQDDPKWKPIIEEANRYVGTIISGSVHPCAHILSNDNLLYEYGVTRLGENVCVLITSSEADEYKVLKNDYLIVKVWKLIGETFKEIGIPIIKANDLLDKIKDDQRIWDLFKNGITCTLNQVDSDNGCRQAKQYGISSFEDGAHIAAAIRPSFDSWREQFLDREDYTTGSNLLDEVLKDTHGYILFQESLMQYFNWLGITPAESIGLIKKISKKKIKQSDFDNLEERLKQQWIQNTGSEEMFSETWHLVQSCMSYGFCVSGDTKLLRNSNGNRFIPTIEEMYKIRNDRQYAISTGHKSLYSKYRSYGYGKAISLCEDGMLRENDIEDIYFSGKQSVYEVVVENGAKIKCTLAHKFPTIDGEKPLKELQIGDGLYVKGEYQNREHSTRLTKSFVPNYPSLGQCGFQKRPNGNSVIFTNQRQLHARQKDCCEICGALYSSDKKFELHHIDQDRTNNCLSNYIWLCNSCHKKVHYQLNRNKRYERGLTTELSKIISIKYVGEENVYSVSMKDPNHTYAVDSGIVTCNCSAHAAATSLDMCYGAYLKVNYSYEYYSVCFNNYVGDKERTNKLTNELEYFGIKLSDIKFRHSNSKYSYDKETHTIFKGMSSIKFVGDNVGEELYSLRDNQYDSFIDLLQDISNTSVNSKQLDILIKLDFFSEFGDINYLLKQVECYDKFYGRKQFTISKLQKEGEDIELIKKYCQKHTEKTLKEFDYIGFLKDTTSNMPYSPVSITERMDYQKEYIGYISYINPNIGKRYYYVKDLSVTKSIVNIQLYEIYSGKTQKVKMWTTQYKKNPFDEGNILYLKSVEKKHKKEPTGEINPKTGKKIYKDVPDKFEFWLKNFTIKNDVEEELK